MTIKRILLTGDDGYKSLGIRMLIAVLKDRYDLRVSATVGQMSAVGGHLSLRDGADIGTATVDGVKTLWVDGYPVDAIDAAQGFFRKPFDLVISGINMGANVSGSLITSGTFAAAFRSITVGLAPRAIAMSWHTHPSRLFKIHDGKGGLGSCVDYPGQAARRLTELAVSRNFWGAKLLNVNFPPRTTEKIRITEIYPRISGYYKYPVTFSEDRKHFTYPQAYASGLRKISADYDCGAINRGYISLTPCHEMMLHREVLGGIGRRSFTLPAVKTILDKKLRS